MDYRPIQRDPTERPTIRAKYNNYQFSDHKAHVIELIMRATTVSVETMMIVDAMKAEPR
jgi:predicted helicase